MIFNFNFLENKQIEIKFSGDSEIFDYVVIATGLDPDLLKFLFDKSDLNFFNGYFAVRGTSDEYFDFIDKKNINLFLGKNSHLVTYPIDNYENKNSIFIFKAKSTRDNFYYKWRYSS